MLLYCDPALTTGNLNSGFRRVDSKWGRVLLEARLQMASNDSCPLVFMCVVPSHMTRAGLCDQMNMAEWWPIACKWGFFNSGFFIPVHTQSYIKDHKVTFSKVLKLIYIFHLDRGLVNGLRLHLSSIGKIKSIIKLHEDS